MNPIYLTEKDFQRLHSLVQAQRAISGAHTVEALSQELKQAKVVASEEIPENVVTMNSLVKLTELKSGAQMELTVVYPKDADLSKFKISVLAPVGSAILGCKVGDKVERPGPKGTIVYEIMEVLYQPEAAGNLNL
ncbi:nucleoside diphosphate kinase regulator [Pontibacter sp. HSC-36F09]|uniref:nucleoside diphosphate kinase regulator n=1 Tax=Pontibacter sp. HSC-36F09 TaxID=2910966 RepID=UPI00209D60B7|nr:nucleoside diphosphate kinase regulator [Pontibacter sp. HSC-36F09]MCP2043342.1 regulator of nucleoside diphosphate kinase [Pontibacter sp. HSC-36F09]